MAETTQAVGRGCDRLNIACPPVSVVISTKGRPDKAVRAVMSCLAQQWENLEILVFDDDPRHQAADAVAGSLSSTKVRVFTTDQSRGLIVNRNRGFVEARGEIVFSLDDDAYFTDPETVSRTMAILESDQSIAAVALPYVEPLARRSLSSRGMPFRGAPGDELRAYVGCAHALRRETALQLGAYREFFVHQVEERDLCMRLWAGGWRIVYGDSGPVVHDVDPRRDDGRILYYACRNQLLNEVLNTPAPAVLVRVARLAAGLLTYRFTWASLPIRLRGLAAGLAQGIATRKLRRPMSAALYRRYRSLPGHGPYDFSGPLPPPCHQMNQASGL